MSIKKDIKMTNNDKVPELTNGLFDDFIKDGLVLIDFYADWCMPCVMMSPVLDELSEKFKGKIKIGKVDIEDNPGIAGRYSVVSIPNFVLLKDGKMVEQFVGSLSEEDFEEKLGKFAQ